MERTDTPFISVRGIEQELQAKIEGANSECDDLIVASEECYRLAGQLELTRLYVDELENELI